MSRIIFPSGKTYDAAFAGDDPGKTLFSASLLTDDIIDVVQSFTGESSFTVESENTGEHIFTNYTVLSELHKWPGSITITLRKEA